MYVHYNFIEIGLLISCNYNEQINIYVADPNTLLLHDNFCDVPNYVLDKVLSHMWDCPRKMVTLNTEERGMLKMNVFVRMATTHMVKENQFDQYYQSDNFQQKLVSLQYWMLETIFQILPINVQIVWGVSQWTAFKTLLYEMSSYFLKECITKWIYQCINCSC